MAINVRSDKGAILGSGIMETERAVMSRVQSPLLPKTNQISSSRKELATLPLSSIASGESRDNENSSYKIIANNFAIIKLLREIFRRFCSTVNP